MHKLEFTLNKYDFLIEMLCARYINW
jgi:hypothetical protein